MKRRFKRRRFTEAPVSSTTTYNTDKRDLRKLAYKDFQRLLSTLQRQVSKNITLTGDMESETDCDAYEITIKDKYENEELDVIEFEYYFDDDSWTILISYTDRNGKYHFVDKEFMDLDSTIGTIKRHIDTVCRDTMNESFRLHRRKQMNEAVNELNKRVRAWYLKTFPDDEAGADIDKTLTWKKLRDAINNGLGSDIYRVIGVGDSVIRERVFEGLADVLRTTFDNVYDAWEVNKPYRTPDHITL